VPGFFTADGTNLLQPSLHLLSTVLLFPSFQNFVIAALGLNNFASFWVFVHLDMALLAAIMRSQVRGGRSPN